MWLLLKVLVSWLAVGKVNVVYLIQLRRVACSRYGAAGKLMKTHSWLRENIKNTPLIEGNIKNLTLFERKYETSFLIEGEISPFDWEKIQMIIIELYSCIVIGAIIEKKADFIVKKHDMVPCFSVSSYPPPPLAQVVYHVFIWKTYFKLVTLSLARV